MSLCVDRPRRRAGIVGCLVLLGGAGLLAGCGGGSSARGPSAGPEAASPPIARVSRLLLIGPYEIALDCILAYGPSANSESGAPATGDPSLTAIVRLAERRGRALPPDLAPDHIWVFHERGTWSTALAADTLAAAGPADARRMAAGGPALAAGTGLEVVVRIRVPGGEDRFVRSDRLRVGR